MTSLIASLVFIATFVLLLTGQHRGSPVYVWTMMWAISWAINAAFGGVFYFSPEVVLVIIVGALAYVIGALLFWQTVSRGPIPKAAHMEVFTIKLQRAPWLTTLMFLSLASIPVLLELGLQKVSGNSLLGFLTGGRSQMFAIMKANQAALYLNNGFNFPAEFKLITLIISFVAVFVCYRMSFAQRVRSDYIAFTCLVLMSALFSAVCNVRSLLLVPIIIGFFSFYVGCILNDRTYLLRRKRTLFGILLSVLAFGIWIVVIQSARLGDVEFSRLDATLEHMRPWLAGYVPALSVWFEGPYQNSDLTWGKTFFRAILAPLGLVSGEGFSDRIDAVDIGNWQTSNAMTIFRVFLQDFGIFGTLVFCFVLGFVGDMSYYKAIQSGGVWIVLLIIVYCSVFFSVNFWFFFYGARVFGVLLALLIMMTLTRQARVVQRKVHQRYLPHRRAINQPN